MKGGIIMINKKLLKSKMALYGDRDEDLSRYLGMSVSTFSLKKNNKKTKNGNLYQFNNVDIEKIAVRYNLSEKDIMDIFFKELVS